MENLTSVQIDKSKDIEVNDKLKGTILEEEPKTKVYTAAEIVALNERKVAAAKALKKIDKEKIKAMADDEKYSDKNVAKMNKDAIEQEQKDAIILASQVEVDEKQVITESAKVKVITERVIVNISQIRNIQNTTGLHPNSPKNLATSPYKHAIPKSIIENTKLNHPGIFIEIFKNGKSVALKSVKNRVFIDYSDPLRVFAYHGYGKAKREFSHNYAQGIKKDLAAFLATCMKKAA